MIYKSTAEFIEVILIKIDGCFDNKGLWRWQVSLCIAI